GRRASLAGATWRRYRDRACAALSAAALRALSRRGAALSRCGGTLSGRGSRGPRRPVIRPLRLIGAPGHRWLDRFRRVDALGWRWFDRLADVDALQRWRLARHARLQTPRLDWRGRLGSARPGGGPGPGPPPASPRPP